MILEALNKKKRGFSRKKKKKKIRLTESVSWFVDTAV